jgi:flagellar protein FlaJ
VIPFSFLPPKLVLTLSKDFAGAGNTAVFFPFLKDDLVQAQYELTPREYAGIAFTAAFANAVFVAFFAGFVGVLAKAEVLFPAIVFALLVWLASFLTIIIYPRIIATRRARKIDAGLIPATRQLLIEIRSGVPLFNAMASVSDGYGEVSLAFKKIVSRINNGIPELDALAEATRENPSLQFRKVLWQISNALKVGGDVGNALDATINELTRLRINEIRRYGQELSPWTMIYMMASVIVPSLGVTMLIVIGSFMNVSLPKLLLWVGVGYLIVFQLFFMNFVKTRRPAV